MCRSLLALIVAGLFTGSPGASADPLPSGVVFSSPTVADTTAPSALWAEYLAAPETPQGQQAALRSLETWAEAGQTKAFLEAIRKIPDASDLWARIDGPLRDAIQHANDPTHVGSTLHRLSEQITSPKGWLTVMAVLGDYYRVVRNDRLAARATYGEAMKYGGDPTLVRELSERLEQVRYPAVGKPAPTFRAETMDGKRVSVEDMRGRPLLLYFWVPWCSPCVQKAGNFPTHCLRFNRRACRRWPWLTTCGMSPPRAPSLPATSSPVLTSTPRPGIAPVLLRSKRTGCGYRGRCGG